MSEGEGAIGIFDSGVGGLTVLGRIIARLPNEHVVYLGDTARVPYGTKSGATVIRYAQACAGILSKRHIKLLVVACNTASAHAMDALRDSLDVPVVGVVEPGVREALRQSRNGRIGVIGTRGTIVSGEYQATFERLAPETELVCKACPLFVPLAEEGWTTGRVPRQVAEDYLGDFTGSDIDTLVLGCTHYPMLKETIASVMGPDTVLIDSAEATSRVVDEILDGMGSKRKASSEGRMDILVSDAPDHFALTGQAFLGRAIERVEWVDF